MNIPEIQRISIEIRKGFERKEIDSTILKELYQIYNPLKDIDSFVTNAMEMFPRLNCGLATLLLRKRLKNGIVINVKYAGENHTFLLLEGNIVVDITADQYNGPKVYVGAIKDPWSVS